MELTPTNLYALSMAAFALILFAINLQFVASRFFMTRLYYLFLKKLAYPMLIRRWFWTGGSRVQALLVAGYIVLNGFIMGIGVHDTTDLVRRLGTMATVNMVPLFLGGRTSLLAEFMGRIVVLQGLIHTGLGVWLKQSPLVSSNRSHILSISAAAALALILLSSFYPARRFFYELFLKIHLILAFFIVISLLFHVAAPKSIKALFPQLAIIVWLANATLRLAIMLYRNVGRRLYSHTGQVVIDHFYDTQDQRIVKAMRINVELKRALKIYPGQYLYLFFSDMGVRQRFQAHPFVISWWDDTLAAKNISFLIEPRSGLTKDLSSKKSLRSVIVDGPYGTNHNLQDYETVILAAQGIGIAGLLPYLRHMTYRRLNQEAGLTEYRRGLLTRKIDVFWVLDDNSQQDWISDWLLDLQTRDEGKKAQPTPVPSDDYWRFIYDQQPVPIIKSLLYKQISRSAGRTKVVVCGVEAFSSSIRSIVLDSMEEFQAVEFAEVDYRPEPIRTNNPAMRPMTWSDLELATMPSSRIDMGSSRTLRSGKVATLNSIMETVDEEQARKV